MVNDFVTHIHEDAVGHRSVQSEGDKSRSGSVCLVCWGQVVDGERPMAGAGGKNRE